MNKLLKKLLILTTLLVTYSAQAEPEKVVTSGEAALNRSDYENAYRLLQAERKNMPSNSDEYVDYSLKMIECLLYLNEIDMVKAEIYMLDKELSKDNQDYYELLLVALDIQEGNIESAKSKLNSMLEMNKLNNDNRGFAVYLLSGIEDDKSKLLKLFYSLKVTALKNQKLRNNLLIERILLLIEAKDFDNSLREIAIYQGYGEMEKEIGKSLRLLRLAYQNDEIKYITERQKYKKVNSIIHKADQKIVEEMTTAKKFDSNYYIALKFAEMSTPSYPSIEHEKNLTEIINYELKANLNDEAIKNIDKLLTIYPETNNRSFYRFKNVDLAIKSKDKERILKAYNQLYEDKKIDNPNRIIAAEAAAKIYIEDKKIEHALALYDFIVKHSESVEELSRINMLIGLFYFNIDNFYLAINYFTNVSSSSTYYKDALFLMVQCELALDNKENVELNLSAIKDFLNSETTPDKESLAILDYFYAEYYASQGKYQEAMELYKKLNNDLLKFKYSVDIALKLPEMYLHLNSYSDAGLAFLNFADKHPDNVNSPKALYKAIYCYNLLNQLEEMKYAVNKLKEKYPNEPYTVLGLFYLVDYAKNQNDFAQALAYCQEIEKFLDANRQFLGQLYYSRALIYHADKRLSKALEETAKLLNECPDNSLNADAQFLAGSIYVDTGENDKSIQSFQNAIKYRTLPHFINVCQGRIADNNFTLYAKRDDVEYINKAIEIYSTLANDVNNNPFLRTQSLYKLGRSYQSLESFQMALDAYNDGIYLALSQLDNGKNIPIIWVNKSAINAIDINLNLGGKNAIKNSQEILEKIKELNPNDSAIIKTLNQKINNKIQSR